MATCENGCGTDLPPYNGRGRPQRFCSDRCRYEAKNKRRKSFNTTGDAAHFAGYVTPTDTVASSLAQLITASNSLCAVKTQSAVLNRRCRRLGEQTQGAIRSIFPEVF